MLWACYYKTVEILNCCFNETKGLTFQSQKEFLNNFWLQLCTRWNKHKAFHSNSKKFPNNISIKKFIFDLSHSELPYCLSWQTTRAAAQKSPEKAQLTGNYQQYESLKKIKSFFESRKSFSLLWISTRNCQIFRKPTILSGVLMIMN